jgi:hypothetical protein
MGLRRAASSYSSGVTSRCSRATCGASPRTQAVWLGYARVAPPHLTPRPPLTRIILPPRACRACRPEPSRTLLTRPSESTAVACEMQMSPGRAWGVPAPNSMRK